MVLCILQNNLCRLWIYIEWFYVLNINYGAPCSIINSSSFFLITSSNDINIDVNIWHTRLCYIGQDRMNKLAKESFLGPLKKVNLSICEHCLVEKTTKKLFGKGTHAEIPL